MKSDQERREAVRDEMLIDMARGIQWMIASTVDFATGTSPLTIMGRLDAHIEELRRSQGK
jgi:hypothetical protein